MATESAQTEVSSTTDAFAERIVDALGATIDVYSIYLGDALGFYRALAEGGPWTTDELAAATDTHER